MKKRNGTISILKLLIMLLCIMGGHFCIAYPIKGGYPFVANGIFVEFFLIITGYYTFKHFMTSNEPDSGVFKYTFHKFIKFMPYLVVSNGIILICLRDFSLRRIWNMFVEDMLLTTVFFECSFSNGSLWMLSSMFIVFPLFCVFCKQKNDSICSMLAILIPLIYYANIMDAVTATFPMNFFRIISGMLLGVTIFYFNQKVRIKLDKRILYILGVLISLVPITMALFQFNERRIQLVCFMVSLTLLLDEDGVASRLSTSLCDFSEKLSMVIYITHWSIAVLVKEMIGTKNAVISLFTYYSLTIFLSSILIFFEEKISKKKMVSLFLEFKK